MDPIELLKSIYLGDRSCKSVLIDSWNRKVAIQVDVISRIRPGSADWDYYTDGDIVDGLLVFLDVRSISFAPSGNLPNDLINDISIRRVGGSQSSNFVFELSVGSVDDSGSTTEVIISISANGFHLEEPGKPGVEIP